MIEQTFQQPDRRSNAKPAPCEAHGTRIASLEHTTDSINKAMDSVGSKLDLILAKITKVEILEERHNNQQVDVDRAHGKIERMETTVEELARETRAFINYSSGRDKVLWAIGAAVLALIIKALFFAAGHGMTP